jgi:hypothetical protein
VNYTIQERNQYNKQINQYQNNKQQSILNTDLFSSEIQNPIAEKVRNAGDTTGKEGFQNVGKTEGLFVWRIEAFKVVAWPTNQYGSFYDGDSYLVLNSKRVSSVLRHESHFWIGNESSQDEYGTAAYKVVQLDSLLGGNTGQTRNVQGHETSLFLSYFKNQIMIMTGGIKSGFNKVLSSAEQHVLRLFQIKGSKFVRVTEVQPLCLSLNSGDAFVLDSLENIFVWCGAECSMSERRKSGEVATQMKNKYNGKPKIVTLDEKDNDDAFWKLIGGRGRIATAIEGGSDHVQQATTFTKKLLQVDQNGNLNEVCSGNIKLNNFNSNAVYVFDTGDEIFIWIGKNSPQDVKAKSMQAAKQYCTNYSRPNYIPISRVEEGEPHILQFL